ncbi:sugar phosphate isomerase/epimerase family protein [Pseudogracilibacillus sp. SO30301A]|uniref:sugar phosphate isomerase/epimerase family protein n=1 Tax=Pseudogracilibacillus sp. SO30301A TaxID=3098291 RepID=UPI00300DC462
MHLSICSWIFGDEPIERVLKFIKKSGYDAIELQAAMALTHTEKIKQIVNDLQLKIDGLTGDAAWPDETKDLANGNPTNRKIAVEYFKEQIKVCNEFGGKYIVICPSAVGKTHLIGKGTEDWDWAIDSVKQLCETAKLENVELIIEPVNRYESSILNTAEDAYRFVNELNHPSVKMLVDTYHMNIEEVDMLYAIENVSDKLGVFHLADNNRQGVGFGHIDFEAVFSKLKEINYDGPLVLECMAPGANPFAANKESMDDLYLYCERTVQVLQGMLSN